MKVGTRAVGRFGEDHGSDYRERVYRALKEHDFDLYQRCIQAGEAVSLTHNANHCLAADIEAAVIMSVADALGVGIIRLTPF
jgi:hypothetical protein